MQNRYLLTTLLLIASSLAFAGSNGSSSIISSIINSQFPFNWRNTAEKQREKSRSVVAQMLDDAFDDGEFQSHIYATFTASLLLNQQQQRFNFRANAGLLTAIPFILHAKTRKIGIGICMVSGAFKVDAACQLPLIDIEHVHESLQEMERLMAERKQRWKMPNSAQNRNDII